MNGCKRASPRWRNSIQAVTARWKSVSSWSNRFVSLGAVALLVACHSATAAAAARAPAPGEGAAAASASTKAPATGAPAAPGTAAAATPGPPGPAPGAAPGTPAPVDATPIPERAPHQYPQALHLLKS